MSTILTFSQITPADLYLGSFNTYEYVRIEPIPCERRCLCHRGEKDRPIRSLLSGHLHFGGVTGNTQLSKHIISDCKILHKSKEEGSVTESSAMRSHERESKLASQEGSFQAEP